MRISDLIALFQKILEVEKRDMLVEIESGEHAYPIRSVVLTSVADQHGDTKIVLVLSHEEKANVEAKYI
jgi:hypothetical protein